MARISRFLVLAAAVLSLALGHSFDTTSVNYPAIRDSYLTQFPTCAHACLSSSCPGSDLACACHNSTLQSTIASCLESSCSFSEALFTTNITQTLCSAPIRDQSARFKAMNIALGAVTFVIVCMRFLSKWFISTRQGFGPDDWAMVVVGIIGIPTIAINIFGLADHGLGKDIWTLDPDIVPIFARYFYVMEILYVVLMTLIKLSLSLFYLDLFPGPTFRRLVWGTIIFNIAFGTCFVVKEFVQCGPTSYYWSRWSDDRPENGHCININASAWAHAAINIAMDLWLIAIPISQLNRLDIPWKRKVAAAVMFMTFAIVTVASLTRLRSILSYANSSNPTWDQWDIAWWSTIEINIGIICTCLPSLRLILTHIFPRIFGANLGLSATLLSPPPQRLGSSPNNVDIEQLELCSNDLTREKSTKTSESSIRPDGVEEVPHTTLPTNQERKGSRA